MIACVTVFFNPVQYKRILNNYFKFRENFSKRIPLYVVEASFTGNFETDADFKIRANSSNQWMWQKERMINWIVDKLPDKYSRYMYSDCDLLFEEGWDIKLLERDGVIQCFGDIEFLDADGKPYRDGLSALKWQLDKVGSYGSPGGCWAYPREVRQYDRGVIGAGDSLIERALMRRDYDWPKRILTEHEYAYYENWLKSVPQYELSYLPIKIQHLFHGSRENRNYVNRHSILKENDYNPLRDVQVAKNGLLSWCSYKPKLHKSVKEYFLSRKEDE